MKKKNLKLWTICLLLFYSLRGVALNCTLTSTMVTVTNATSMANFMAQVNNATTGCPGAVTYVAGTNTYTLSGFVPQLRIIGNVNVDANFTIDNCQQILMDDNAEIDVANFCTLYIEGSILKAFGANMWKGVYANQNWSGSGSWQPVRIYNSTIKDAKNAIHLIINGNVPNATCEIYNTTFDKNYTGILVEVTASTTTSPIHVRKSRFTCSSTLLAPYANQYTTAGIVASAVANLVVGDIADNSIVANYNVFDGIACGVFSFLSTTNVYSSKFNNIQQLATTLLPSTLQDYYTGVGVYQRGWYASLLSSNPDPTTSNQNAINSILVSSCQFANCLKGVELHNTHATVESNIMSTITNGIIIQNCNTANVNITGNTMDAAKFGMFFSLNYNSNINIYNSNTIEVLSPYNNVSYYGIRVVDWPSNNGHYLVQGNNVTGGTLGIRVENANNTSTIQHNTIVQTNVNTSTFNTANVFGIQAINCNGSKIIENTVTGYTGTWNSYYHQTGILLNNSLGTIVRCNQIQTTGYGIWAQGNNTTTDQLENNTLNNHFYGLYESKLSSAYGKVGNQGTGSDFNGNLFNGTYTGTFKTFNSTDAAQNASTTDKFWYNNTNSAMYTTNFSSSSPINKPIQVAPIPGSYSTPAACPVYFGRPGGGGGGSSMANVDAGLEAAEALAIAEETKTYTEFEEVSKWLDERKLYDALDETSTSESVLVNFYDDKSSESVGRFKAYNNALEELAHSTNAADYAQKLAAAKQLNNEVPANHSFEQNEKDMNDIFLNNLATKGLDKFDVAQTARIRALAESCPFVDGKAVYLARALYSLVEPNVIFDDASICEAMGAYKKEQVKSIPDTRREKYAFISPNPTRNTANLFLNLDEQETGALVLHDLLGNTVLTYSLVANKTFQTISLDDVNSGTYFYRIQTTNGFKSTGKVVVIK